VDREKPKKFKNYEICYFHIDIAEPEVLIDPLHQPVENRGLRFLQQL
jgi:hypothetical protein